MTSNPNQYGNTDMAALKDEILVWCRELGFQQAGVSDIDLTAAFLNIIGFITVLYYFALRLLRIGVGLKP